MKKETVILTLGLLVALLPFLGLPRSWKTALFVLFGLAVALIAYLLREHGVSHARVLGDERRTDAYVQNGVTSPSKPTRIEVRQHADSQEHTP